MVSGSHAPLKRREDLRFTTGQGRYTGDLAPEGLAHVVFVRSPHAHAQIVSIDVEAARANDGVLAVYTAADLYAAGLKDAPGGIGFNRPDGSPAPTDSRPSLASTRVRHVGEAVVAIIAETYAQAADAAELVNVAYDLLPVVNAANVKQVNGPKVWDHVAENIGFRWTGGDKVAVESALQSAHHVTSLTMQISRVAVNSMETRNVLVLPKDDGGLTVHASHQTPFALRDALRAAGFGEHISVELGDVGGSFGLKVGYMLEAVPVAHAARSLGRPVIWESTRNEAFLTDDHAREITAHVDIGFDDAQRIIGMRVQADYHIGAYLSPKSGGLINNMGGFAGVYDIPAIYSEVEAVFTNTNFLAAYRGAGRPEASLFVERTLDVAARELGISPIQLRRKNLIPTSKMPYQTAMTFQYDCGEFDKVLDKAADLARVTSFDVRRKESESRGKLRGLGVSYTIELAGGPFGVFAPDISRVSLLSDGRLRLQSGSMSVGQSHETVFSQMVADRFGVPVEEIVYDMGRTDVLPFGRQNGGSSASGVGGSAVTMATDAFVEELTKRAASLLDVPQAAVTFSDGVFRVGNRSVTLSEIAAANRSDEEGVSIKVEATFKPSAGTFPNGAHICEVEIDPDTGDVEIVAYSAVEDIGTVLNPMIADGQIQGGIVQGIGQVLGEEVIYNSEGEMLTGSFMDYRMPRAADFCDFELAFHPVKTKVNPLGAKGVGEAGTVGALSSAMNAVNDALSGLNIRHFDMPATPLRVWKAIQEARSKA